MAMIYKVLQWIMRRSLSAHYLQIKADLQKVPKKGPLLIAANHPNSFLDAIIIACLIDRPLHFLARSDVFAKSWSDYILRQLNLIPIYRKQEGIDKLDKNQHTFEESSAVLADGGAILVFVEGVSVMDMKLRPLKKGLGRIIVKHLQAKPNARLKVASIGINYDRPKEFRSKVLVASGDTVEVNSAWLNEFNHPHKAIISLNDRIYQELAAHIIQVENEEETEFHTLSEMDSSYRENSLSRKILIAKTIKKMQELHPIQASRLKEDSRRAQEILSQYRLNYRKLKSHQGFDYSRLLIWVVLMPLAGFSLLINIMPLLVGKLITQYTVKEVEFYASVRIVLNSLLWLFFQLAISMLLSQFHWLGILYMPLAYMFLRFYLWYRESTHYLRSTRRLMKLRKAKKDYLELQGLLKEIYRIRASFGLGQH